MTAGALAQAGGVLGASGLSLLLVAERRTFRLAGLAALAVGMALFLPLLVPSDHEVVLFAAAVVAVPVVAALAYVLRRYPWALAFLVILAAPVRIPVTIGETSANLLLPLYVVIAVAAVALAWSIWRDPPRRELGALAWPLAALVLWFGLSGLWTSDVRNAAVFLFFFVLPFGLLAVALARLPWSSLQASRLYGLAVTLAVVFAAIGIWQWATRDVFWNPNVIVANAYAPFYRVNSVFWDPSIYGRFLAIAILALLALLLFQTRRGTVFDLALGAAIVFVWVGLLFSFSQSSFVALAFGIVLAAVLAWRWRALVAVAVVAVVMIPVGIASPQLENLRDSFTVSTETSLTRTTGGRSKLVAVGLRIARDHPVLGVGIGGFKEAYAERVTRREAARTTASHTTPVTVAAETGLVGLVIFAWFVAAGLYLVFRRVDTSSAAGRARLIAGLGFAAIVVHSLFYNAFFEDPLTWALLAIAAIAATASEPAPAAETETYSTERARSA
jgi:putative inorganic carbon (HCO3(-)) transporter